MPAFDLLISTLARPHLRRWPAVQPLVLRAGLAVFLGYYLGAVLGFALTIPASPVSTLWSPNAILMGAFLLTPQRVWLPIWAAAFPAHMVAELTAGIPATMALAWFFSNGLEAFLGASLLLRYGEQPFRLDRLANVAILMICAGFLAPFASSFVDATFVTAIGWGQSTYWEVWRSRFFANALASLTFIPVILAWSHQGLHFLSWASPKRFVEAGVVAAGLFLVSVIVFGQPLAGPETIPALLYAPIPFLVWAAVRFGPIGASSSLLFTVLFAIWNAAQSRGPFVSNDPPSNALSIQLLFGSLAITLMSLAAVVDERRRAQEVGRQSSEHLRLALEAAQTSAWSWPITAPASSVSRAAAITTSQLYSSIPDDWLSTVHPEDRPAVQRAIQRAIAQRTPYKKEFRVLRPDGTTGWVLGKGKLLHDEEGHPIRLIGIHADITERKAAEVLAAARNHILEKIASGAPLLDTLTRLVTLVEAEAPGLLCSILLLDPDGVHIRHGAAPSLPEAYVRAINGLPIGPNMGSCGTAMHLKRPVIVTDILEDPLWGDFRTIAVEHGLRACWSTPLLSQKGKVLGSFAMYYREPRAPNAGELELIDFATHLGTIALERSIVEAEAEEQRSELAHLGRVAVLGGLSGALAHELSQPLASILSDAQAGQRFLARNPPDVKEVRAILKDIVTAHQRAGMVIDRLRGLLSKRHGEFSPLDMNNVIGETLQLMRGDLGDRQVQATTELDPQLALVLGDRVQLIQVLINLIMNACEAMSSAPAAERHLKIVTSGSGDSVRVSVVDRGVGIPEELMRRIGEPFLTSKPQGLGLGLSISRTILVAHGGGLRLENNADRGATFHLVLPTAEPSL